MNRIYIIEEDVQAIDYFIVEASSAAEAKNKFAKGEFYTFGNTPEEISRGKVKARKTNENDRKDKLYIQAINKIEKDKEEG